MEKAWNGESTFANLCQRETAIGWKQFSQWEKEVHPGADCLNFSRTVRGRALSDLSEGHILSLNRVEPRIIRL